MAKFWLINTVILSTTKMFPGDSVDDSVEDANAIRSAGGLLWPQGNPVVDAAASEALTARTLKGANEAELQSIMEMAVDSVQPEFTSVTNLYHNAMSGSDSAVGTDSTSPVATLKESARRLSGKRPRALATLFVLANVVDPADFCQVSALIDAVGTLGPEAVSSAIGTGPAAPIIFKVKGTRTLASFTDPNTLSTLALTLTADITPPRTVATTIAAGSNGAILPQATINVVSTTGMPTPGKVNIETSNGMEVVAYTGTTGTTLTGCTGGTGTMSTGGDVKNEMMAMVAVTGFDWTPHIGRICKVLASSVSAAVDTHFVVGRIPSTGVAECTPLMSTNNANLTTVYTGTSGSTVAIYTLTTWAPHMSLGDFPGAQVEYEDMDFPAATPQTLRGLAYSFRTCIIRRPFRGGFGGEMGPQIFLLSSAVVFAAPPGGRSPSQLSITNGQVRCVSSAFINVDMREREPDAKALFTGCIFVGGCFKSGGANDASRVGAEMAVANFPTNAYGCGFYDWPVPDLLAPVPATTRGSDGAAVTLGHGAWSNFGGPLYGNSSGANTVFHRVKEGASARVCDYMTDEAAPVNPGSPAPNFVANSLGGCGTLGQLFLDEDPTTGTTTPTIQPTHIPSATKRGVYDGSVAPGVGNFKTLKTWKQWRTDFARNAVGLNTGASIVNIAS